jgi:TM2 domain-containing membrane protein YozV
VERPGIAHFFVFWGFLVLFLTIIEAYGHLFTDTFAIPLIGRSPSSASSRTSSPSPWDWA